MDRGIMSSNDSIISEDQNRNKLLVESISDEISCMPSLLCSIFRVPIKFHVISKDTYTPRIISIGPYHHGKKHLEATKRCKLWYLHSLLSRTSIYLPTVVNAIMEIEAKIRECYAEPVHFSSDEFVKMMIFDGVFILELLLKYQEEQSNVESKDCVFNTTWMVPSLRRDLVLLENQIPFIVLDVLFKLINSPPQALTLIELIADFFDPILPQFPFRYEIQGQHLLDLLRNFLINQSHKYKEIGNSPTWEYTTCATNLQNAGVKFKKKTAASSLLDITFSEYGEFEMPSFFFGELWTVLFPNLIALEQCRRDYSDCISSYVILVNRLVNSLDDVKLLCDKGIIDGSFVKDERVVAILDKLCQGVLVDEFYYDGICTRVNAYRKTHWSKWRATLYHDYFRTPWHTHLYIAATLLLVLTLTQTLFAIRYRD